MKSALLSLLGSLMPIAIGNKHLSDFSHPSLLSPLCRLAATRLSLPSFTGNASRVPTTPHTQPFTALFRGGPPSVCDFLLLFLAFSVLTPSPAFYVPSLRATAHHDSTPIAGSGSHASAAYGQRIAY